MERRRFMQDVAQYKTLVNAIEDTSAKCAKGAADIKPNDTVLQGSRAIPVEANYKATDVAGCLWRMTSTVTGPIQADFMVMEGKTWNFPGYACTKQDVNDVQIIACTANQVAAKNEGFGRVSIMASIEELGTGQISVKDATAGVDDTGNYEVIEPIVKVHMPIITESDAVQAKNDSPLAGTIFSWEVRDAENVVIVPIVEIDANGNPINTVLASKEQVGMAERPVDGMWDPKVDAIGN